MDQALSLISFQLGRRLVILPIWQTEPGLFSRLANDWATANMPIKTAIKSIPFRSSTCPKVKRFTPVTGSMPTVPSIRPKAPAINPLTIESLPRLVIMVSPRKTSAKYSGGPKESAYSESRGPTDINTSRLNVPATQEPMAVIPKAQPARPGRSFHSHPGRLPPLWRCPARAAVWR